MRTVLNGEQSVENFEQSSEMEVITVNSSSSSEDANMEITAEQRAAAASVNMEASKTLSAALGLDDRGTPNRRIFSLSTRRSGSEESNGKRSRPPVPAASEQEQPKQRRTAGREYATEPPLNDQTMGGELLPVMDIEAARQRDLAKEREIKDEVKQCCQQIKWKRNKIPKTLILGSTI